MPLALARPTTLEVEGTDRTECKLVHYLLVHSHASEAR